MPIYDDMPFSPSADGRASPGQLIDAIVFDVLMRCNVCKPATVVAWVPPVPGTLCATVTVLIDFMYARAINNATELRPGETISIESAGIRAIGQWVTIPNVPIVYFGSPAFGHRGAIPVGTTGMLLFADTILDQWKSRGGPLDPAMYERHSLNCGIFVPVLYHGLNTPVMDPLVDVLGPNDDTAGFEIATGTDKSIRMYTTGPNANVDAAAQVQLGNPLSPLQPVGRLGDKTSADVSMTATLAALVAQSAVLAGLGFGVAAPAPTDFGFISEGSTKVVAE